MDSQSVNRLKTDLETMKTAVGLGPRMGVEDVWNGLGLGLVGLMISMWEWMSPDLPTQWQRALFLIPWIGVAVFFGIKYRQGPGRTAARDREWSLGFLMTIPMVACLVLFQIWLNALGVRGFHAVGGMLFMSGCCLLPLAFTDRW